MGGSVGTCNVSVSHDFDRNGQLVESHVPVDHASVGLAQARPSHLSAADGAWY